MKNLLIAGALALVMLSGCTAATLAVDQQRFGGQNVVEAEFNVPDDEKGLESFRAVFAKDCTECALSVEIGAGRKMIFNGKGIRGSGYATVLADVTKALSANNTDLSKATGPELISALGKVLAP
jgi:hypothetical protein